MGTACAAPMGDILFVTGINLNTVNGDSAKNESGVTRAIHMLQAINSLIISVTSRIVSGSGIHCTICSAILRCNILQTKHHSIGY